MNELALKGAQIVFEDTHVSGHACREELRLIYALTKPKYAIPVHGEYRHLMRHRELAIEMGKLKNSWIFTSESCVIDSLGGEFVRDVEPGEMVVVDEKGFHSYKSKLLPDKTSFCLFEYVYIARPDSVINGVCVHNAP